VPVSFGSERGNIVIGLRIEIRPRDLHLAHVLAEDRRLLLRWELANQQRLAPVRAD
jgi:hypothetical protein